MTLEGRLLRMLGATPGIASYRILEQALGRTPRKDARECLRTAMARARKLLAPGERIENHRDLGYELIRTEPRAA